MKRGSVCLNSLLDLNPDVEGEYINSNIENFCISEVVQLQTYDVIISVNNQDVNK